LAVNVFLGTGGKLLANVSIFEVDAFEVVSFLGTGAFLGTDAFLGAGTFLGAGAFLGADAFLGVNFFGIFPKIRFVNGNHNRQCFIKPN
jgi:hypothetical protein